MKLIDILENLEAYPAEGVILARLPWTADCEASVFLVQSTDLTTLDIDGLKYFMTVVMAAISRNEFFKHGLAPDNASALCDALTRRALLQTTEFDRPRPKLPNAKPMHGALDRGDGEEPAVQLDRTSTYKDFLSLSSGQRGAAFQRLNPYDDPVLFEEVRLAFLEAHPECGPPHEVGVGEVGMLGPMNGVAVKVAAGQKVRVPRGFMGMPVIKLVTAKNGGWKRAR